MEKEKRLTIWYEELEGDDYPLVGKKNANLGEMMKGGIPVAPGFALTLRANDLFMTEGGIKNEIAQFIGSLGEMDLERCQKASEFSVQLIEQADVPPVVVEEALTQYEALCGKAGVKNLPVAVRSSGAVSMPGQMETYLNIRGADDLIKYIRKTWASAYHVEAITYRINKGMDFLLNIGIGVPKMVNSRLSGVIFTLCPLNGDRSKISVDVSYGLGEAVVSGIVTPDNILVDKVTLSTVRSIVGSKEVKCVYNESGSDIRSVDVPPEDRRRLCVTTEELQELCRVAKVIDKYYGQPYDIEFAIDGDLPFPDNVIVLQVRPESVWSKKKTSTPKTETKQDALARVVAQLMNGVRVASPPTPPAQPEFTVSPPDPAKKWHTPRGENP
ncbi:MAG: PEP/pyruvate-binding domain-containing protein [Actinobacteria bacterium]|nr:PEP/pyruvate-binding domain-containing protein [Actinomycetota bacterium]